MKYTKLTDSQQVKYDKVKKKGWFLLEGDTYAEKVVHPVEIVSVSQLEAEIDEIRAQIASRPPIEYPKVMTDTQKQDIDDANDRIQNENDQTAQGIDERQILLQIISEV